VGVSHEDGGLDSSKGVAGQGRASTTADSVVHDLTTLVKISVLVNVFGSMTYLAVSDEDNLSRRALLVVRSNSFDNRSGSLRSRVVVADTTACTSSATGWVDNGLRSGTRVGRLDRVHKTSSSSVAIALRLSGLTSAENVDFGARLPLSEFDRASGSEASE
jgi:hypothetical protein